MLDLLTSQDLKSMQGRNAASHDKVYLVLTYSVAFDRYIYYSKLQRTLSDTIGKRYQNS